MGAWTCWGSSECAECGADYHNAWGAICTARQSASHSFCQTVTHTATPISEGIMRRIGAAWLALLLQFGAAHAATLRIGLNEDPDALDPARGGSFVGRVVFASVCDKLIDTDQNNEFVPQLATAWSWSPDNLALTLTLRDGVTFHDGEHF